MARILYRVVVQPGRKERLLEKLRVDQTLKFKQLDPINGEEVIRMEIEIVGLEKKKQIEGMLKADKNDIIGEGDVLEGKPSDIKERRTIVVAKTFLRFFVSYAVIFASIISSALSSDYTKLTSGSYPWDLVSVVSIPLSIGNVYGVDKTKTS